MITAVPGGRNAKLPGHPQRLIIHRVIRRLHVPHLSVGDNPLDPGQSRHARDVLRMTEGEAVEVFDDSGAVAIGTLVFPEPKQVIVRVVGIETASTAHRIDIVVASAVPKGERADWIVEKLSELGVTAFIPLVAQRSVVKPDGKNKRERWIRIATESAKQSRRVGVMRIDELRTVPELLKSTPDGTNAFYLSTRAGAPRIVEAFADTDRTAGILLLIGPEGGWTDDEIRLFDEAGWRGVGLTTSILRVETAAIAAATAAILLAHPKSSLRNA
jgi:16S rRNA (uracil1498-N3)-methyltransferase